MTLTRYVLPVRAMTYSPSGMHVISAGGDSMIKFTDVESGKVFQTIMCEAYVTSVSNDPEGDYLSVTHANGLFKVYSIQHGKTELSVKSGCTKVDITKAQRTMSAWHPDGSLVAVPYGDGSIVLRERLSWEITDELSGEHQGGVYLVRFSPNGLYLVSTGADQSVVVWDLNEKTCVARRELPAAACSVIWREGENQLIMMTEDGGMVVWEKPVPENRPHPCTPVDKVMAEDEAAFVGTCFR